MIVSHGTRKQKTCDRLRQSVHKGRPRGTVQTDRVLTTTAILTTHLLSIRAIYRYPSDRITHCGQTNSAVTTHSGGVSWVRWALCS